MAAASTHAAARGGFAIVVLVGALAGLAAGTIPGLARLETDVGLAWLFNLRGERASPPEVVLLGIGRASARALDLPPNPRKWPRSRHAQMLDALRRSGARVVVFDVMFEDPRDPEQDGAFAEAIRRAQNVILFQYLERELLRSADGAVLADVQRMRDPLPLLAGAAAGLAPFPLPKAGARVDHVWLFKRGAGDVPTMPSVALQQYALQHWPDWAVLLRAALADAPAGHEGPRAAGGLPSEVSKHAPDGAEPDVALLTAATRALFQRHPQLAPRLRAALGAADLEPATRRTLGALVHLYAEPGDRTLDHYGGAGALATLPYHQVLSAPRRAQARLRGRAVFIG